MIGRSSGARAARATGSLARRITKRTMIGGAIGVGGASAGYYMGRRNRANAGITSNSKGIYGY